MVDGPAATQQSPANTFELESSIAKTVPFEQLAPLGSALALPWIVAQIPTPCGSSTVHMNGPLVLSTTLAMFAHVNVADVPDEVA